MLTSHAFVKSMSEMSNDVLTTFFCERKLDYIQILLIKVR